MSVSLVDFFPYELKRINSREYAGPCPFCADGDDRFRLWVDREPREQAYWCRKCGASGDAIALVEHIKDCGYHAACDLLGIDPKKPKASKSASSRATSSPSSRPSSSRPSGSSPSSAQAKKEQTMPSETWRTAAAAWLAECQQHLRTSREAWQALADRYIVVETALGAGIGWNPQTQYIPRSAWGLPVGQDGKDKLVLPAGLVLSVRRSCGVVGLTVRRYGEGNGPRYRDITGGASLPFALGKSGQPVMIVESVLDAVLIRQESQGQIAVVATFGTAKGFDEPALTFIRQAQGIYLCPDCDEAGAKAYAGWRELFPQGKLLLVPEGADVKDPTEMQDKAFTLLDSSVPTVSSWLYRHVLAHIGTQDEGSAQGQTQTQDGEDMGTESKCGGSE